MSRRVRLAGRHVVFCACFLGSGLFACCAAPQFTAGQRQTRRMLNLRRSRSARSAASAASERRARRVRPRPRWRSAAPSGPSRTAVAPAPVSAAISSSPIPPSGPTISISESACAKSEFRQRFGRGLVQHQHRRTRRRPRRDIGDQFGGRHHRRTPTERAAAGLPGRRSGHRLPPPQPLVRPSRRRPSGPRSASACQATNASAPASVASSIASSERSDFGSACTTVTVGRRRADASVASARAPSAWPLATLLDDARARPCPRRRRDRVPRRPGCAARWRRGSPRRRRRRRARRPRAARRRRTARGSSPRR